MERKHIQIAVELRKDSRAQLTAMSKRTNIPVSTIYDALKNKLPEIITQYVALLNFDALGYVSRAKVCIKCGKQSKLKLYEFLAAHHNVNSLWRINNGFDYMAELVFRNVKEMEEFFEYIDDSFQIKNRETYYIIQDLVKERFLSEELYIDLLNQR